MSPRSRSSSRVGACTCAFLPNCSISVTHTFAWIKGSVALPRGFPTGLSLVPTWCESILGLKVKALQGKQVSLEWTETSGGLWEWWPEPGVPHAFPVESACSRDATVTPGILSRPAVKGTRLSSKEAETSSSGCGRNSRASSRVESGMSGNFLSCSKGVKNPLEVPEGRCD